MLTKQNEIEDFIKEYQRSRVVAVPSVRAALNRALDFEQKFQKVFYEFTKDEVLEMYKSVDAISARSLQNINLILKHAARWILHNQQKDISNIYDAITKELIQECVNTDKRDGLILSRVDLNDLKNELLNDTDKAILELLFLGVGGNNLKELTFLNMSQVDRKSGVLYFKTGKTIPIDDEAYHLIRQACSEEELISLGETMRIIKVISHGIFKQRPNTLSASDDYNDPRALERRFRFVQRRLLLMSKEFGVQLTSGNLQTSGLLHYLRQGVAETKLSFREYVKTQEAIDLAKRYDIFSELAPQILLEKFEQYF